MLSVEKNRDPVYVHGAHWKQNIIVELILACQVKSEGSKQPTLGLIHSKTSSCKP